MSHMVIFNGVEGQPRYHQAESLEDAVKFAEHLRNAEGLDNTKIFKLSEVTFEFRPYFRVEVGVAGEPDSAVSDEVDDALEEVMESIETDAEVEAAETVEAVEVVESVDEEPEAVVDEEFDTDEEDMNASEPSKSRIFSRS